MADDLGGFFFDVRKWRGSNAVRRMSFAERGVYLEMMCEQWEKRNLPDNAEAVADQIATTTSQVEEVLSAWAVVRAKFVTSKGAPDRIYNAPLEDTRRKQRLNLLTKRAAGRQGGKASAAKRWGAQDLSCKQPLTTVKQCSTTVEQPSTVVNRLDRIRLDQIREEKKDEPSPPPPPDARSKRPIFTGQALTVFEWMLDDCVRTLRDHVDAFDLHSWFFDLDQRAAKEGLVIPKRDGGAWLQAQLVAEAQRRGLAVKFATVEEPDPWAEAARRGPSKRPA